MKPLNAEVHLSRVSEVFFSGKREKARKSFFSLPRKKNLWSIKVHSTLKWNRFGSFLQYLSCRDARPRRHLKVHVSVAMEEDYVIFHGSGEGERRVERQVKQCRWQRRDWHKSWQMFEVSHTADYCNWTDVFQATSIPADPVPVISNWKVVKIVDVRVPASSAFQVLP